MGYISISIDNQTARKLLSTGQKLATEIGENINISQMIDLLIDVYTELQSDDNFFKG